MVSPLSERPSETLVTGRDEIERGWGRATEEVGSGWQVRGVSPWTRWHGRFQGSPAIFFSSSLAREMTYDIFLRGFSWLVSG